MKDLIRMAVYGSIAIATILALVYFSSGTGEKGTALGVIAVVVVVVLPVIIGIWMAKKEKQKERESA